MRESKFTLKNIEKTEKMTFSWGGVVSQLGWVYNPPGGEGRGGVNISLLPDLLRV